MKRAIKATVGLMMAVALLCGSALAGSAGTYTVDELYMEITVPEGYYVFSLDTVEDDPDISRLGLNGEGMAQAMETGNIYLDIVPEDLSWELCLIMGESEEFLPIYDFNLFGEKSLNEMMSKIPEEYEKMGLTIQDWSFWQGEQAKFIIINSTQSVQGRELHRRQFYTIYNGQAIHLTMISQVGTITDAMDKLQKTVAESIHFTETFEPPQVALDTAEEAKRKERSILLEVLKGAAVGAVIGASGYGAIKLLGKKNQDVPDSENGTSTGGNDL